MKQLAINDGIGSSLGLFEDGTPVFCVQEERFSRIKNDMGFPAQCLAYVLDKGMVKADEIDQVVFTNEHYTDRTKDGFYANYDKHFERAASRNPIQRGLNAGRFMARRLLEKNKGLHQSYDRAKFGHKDEDRLADAGFDRATFRRVDHHLCHAAAAYHGLAENLDDDYLVLTLDGGGDGITSAVYKGAGGHLEKLSDSRCFSIGNIYSDITYILGFTPHEHEYKLMGLAPYVNPKYVQLYTAYFSQLLDLTDDDTVFCNPIPLNHTLCFSKFLADLKKDRFDNVAAGLQAFTEAIVLRWVQGCMKKYSINKVLCSGGVFMNVKLNKLIADLPDVEYVDVFPSCGDETNIFGAAFHAYNETTRRTVGLLSTFTLGTTPDDDLAAALEQFKDQIAVEQLTNPNQYIADRLVADEIVARCSGPMEFGARALGNRSIMANPGNLATVNKINRAIKNRDFWMPFAPAVLEERVEDLLECPASLAKQKSPYMMFAMAARKERRQAIVCGIHQADFTARPETINPTRYPDVHEIITRFHEKTGTPSVLNTSFNLHGFPIVENSAQAIDVLLRSELDVLVIGTCAIRRKAG